MTDFLSNNVTAVAGAYVIVGIAKAIVDWRKSKLDYKVAMVDAQSRARARDTASDIRLRDSFSKVAQSHGDQVSALIDALTRAGSDA